MGEDNIFLIYIYDFLRPYVCLSRSIAVFYINRIFNALPPCCSMSVKRIGNSLNAFASDIFAQSLYVAIVSIKASTSNVFFPSKWVVTALPVRCFSAILASFLHLRSMSQRFDFACINACLYVCNQYRPRRDDASVGTMSWTEITISVFMPLGWTPIVTFPLIVTGYGLRKNVSLQEIIGKWHEAVRWRERNTNVCAINNYQIVFGYDTLFVLLLRLSCENWFPCHALTQRDRCGV